MTEPVLESNESSEELEKKTVKLQKNINDQFHMFILAILELRKKHLNGIKKYFTRMASEDLKITRDELQNIGVNEFIHQCKNVEWYKCEAYLESIIGNEQNVIFERILEDFKALIRVYVKDRIVYRVRDNRAIYRVDYQYDRYSAKEWPYIQDVAVKYLGPKTLNLCFSIIKREKFSDPIQTSDSYYQGAVVTIPTKPLPQSTKDNVVRKDKIVGC